MMIKLSTYQLFEAILLSIKRIKMTINQQSKTVPRRHLPTLTDSNRLFWQGGKTGKLLIQRCHDCGDYVHPPGPICPSCHSFNVKAVPVSGRATVATFTINRQVWEKGLEAPYIVAIVELDEQKNVRITTNIIDCAIDDVVIGMPVEVVFEQNEDVWLPLFRPVKASGK